jgi:hypothetical protein
MELELGLGKIISHSTIFRCNGLSQRGMDKARIQSKNGLLE